MLEKGQEEPFKEKVVITWDTVKSRSERCTTRKSKENYFPYNFYSNQVTSQSHEAEVSAFHIYPMLKIP